jgi:hypothetical protein
LKTHENSNTKGKLFSGIKMHEKSDHNTLSISSTLQITGIITASKSRKEGKGGDVNGRGRMEP